MSELDCYLEEHTLMDAKSVIAYIKQQYNVEYSLSGVTDLLHRLGRFGDGFVYQNPSQASKSQGDLYHR